jgi:AcrR family transcriptional regulator
MISSAKLEDSALPRTPDPELEQRLAKAALRLLDTGGLLAITLRSVAREADTTTPTIYERFTNREKLIEAAKFQAELELLGEVRRCRNITEYVKRVLEYGIQHPQRFELRADTFGFRLATGEPMPVYDLLKEHLGNELRLDGAKREELAMAIASLVLGTARGMIAAGARTPAAQKLHRTCLAAVQVLVKAFSD